MSKTKSLRAVRALVAMMAVLMLSLCMTATAFATDGYTDTVSTTSVQVKVGSANPVTVDFSSLVTDPTLATSTSNAIAPIKSTSPIAGVYYKNSAWKVVGGKDYVEVKDILAAAGVNTNNVESVKFYVYEFDRNTNQYDFGYYTKYYKNSDADSDYNPGDYIMADFTAALPMYGGMSSVTSPIAADTNGVGNMTSSGSFYASLALQNSVYTLGSDNITYLSDVISTVSDASSLGTSNAPRLVMGYDSVGYPDSQPGNRFPTDIVGITVTLNQQS